MRIYKTNENLKKLNNPIVDYVLNLLEGKEGNDLSYRRDAIFGTLLFARVYGDITPLECERDYTNDFGLVCALKNFEYTEENKVILDDLLFKIYADDSEVKPRIFERMHHYQDNGMADYILSGSTELGEFPKELKKKIEDNLEDLADYVSIKFGTTWCSDDVNLETPTVEIYFIKPELRDEIDKRLREISAENTPSGLTKKLNV